MIRILHPSKPLYLAGADAGRPFSWRDDKKLAVGFSNRECALDFIERRGITEFILHDDEPQTKRERKAARKAGK